MRASFVSFMLQHPGRKFRHEKPDMKILLERKEEDYVDVSQAWRAWEVQVSGASLCFM